MLLWYLRSCRYNAVQEGVLRGQGHRAGRLRGGQILHHLLCPRVEVQVRDAHHPRLVVQDEEGQVHLQRPHQAQAGRHRRTVKVQVHHQPVLQGIQRGTDRLRARQSRQVAIGPCSFKNVKHWIRQVKINAGDNVYKLVLGNKLDLEEGRKVSSENVKELSEETGV